MMKTLLSALLVGSAALLMAAETALTMNKTTDFQKINGTGVLTLKDNVFELKGPMNYRSKGVFAVDPGKSYKVTGEFKAKDGTKPAILYFGIVPFNAQKRQIYSETVYVVKGTNTELTADVKVGDTVLKAKDCSKWKFRGSVIAFNAKADFSDVPNSNLSPVIKDIKKDGDVYTITLTKPIKKAYPKGTAIRQHRPAGTYQYCAAAGRRLTNQWTTYSVVMDGEAPKDGGLMSKKWWHGTRHVRLLLLGNYGGNKDSVLQFRNLKIEELTR